MRLTLAHLVLPLLASSGCHLSHGLEGAERDAGVRALDASPSRDAGRRMRDAGRPTDAGTRVDAGFTAGCEPEDARAEPCPGALCDGPPTWHWDGERCVAIECGACVGDDCPRGTFSEAACEAAHATCVPALCRATGGEWLWWAEECGHFECGFPPPEICFAGMPVCDCGAGRRYVDGVGCVDDPSCPEVDPLPPETLCTSTGGSWDALCCHTECGQPCDLACAAPACNCGPMRVFDALRGCVLGTRCFERQLGESCHPEARCAGSSICCDDCGGPGCRGEPTCRPPVCDDDPNTDICGNDVLAP